MSSGGSHVSRRNSRRERRSQSCMELQGKQILLASLSTLSLPPTTFPSRTQPQSSRFSPSPTAHSHSTQSLCSDRPTKSSRLRAHSAPVKYAEPDYKCIARRKKESVFVAKTLTAEKILKCKIPEGQSLHSFLTGGRYNSTHHMDSRSLQRLGVYVPRNSSAKMFMNPAGTIPPSPAVYGMHPLKKHLPLVFPNPSTPALPSSNSDSFYSTNACADRSLFLAEKDLECQLQRDNTDSSCSLPSRRSSINVDQNGTCSADGDEKSEPNEILHEYGHRWQMGQMGREVEESESKPVDISSMKDKTVTKVTNVCHPVKENRQDCPMAFETDVEEAVVGGNDSDCTAVSDSDLLSPEAQLLTQEILLETESLCCTKSVSSRICKQHVAKSPVKKASDNSHKALSPNTPLKSPGHEQAEQPHKYQLQFRHELKQTSIEVLEKQTPPGKMVEAMSVSLNTSNEHKPSYGVNVLQHHSTARPQSATIGRQGVDQRSQMDTSKRPQSAIQVSHSKQAAIFVDLRKLHPLHAENATLDTKDSL